MNAREATNTLRDLLVANRDPVNTLHGTLSKRHEQAIKRGIGALTAQLPRSERGAVRHWLSENAGAGVGPHAR